jgi:hypothetical protein
MPSYRHDFGILFLSAVVILVAFLVGTSNLYGQAGKTWMGISLDQQVQEAKLNLGPLKLKPVFYLSDAGYDSNIYRANANPIKDYSATIGPGFNIYFPIKNRLVISAYESPQYLYFAETKGERAWNNYFHGQIHLIFQRFFLTLGKAYSSAREIWNTEIDSRPRRKEDSLEGSALCQFSQKTSVSIGYQRAKINYEDLSNEPIKIGERLNRIENQTNLIAYYQLSYRTMFFLNMEYRTFLFENPSNNKDSKSYSIFSGFEFSPLGIVKGRINLGYKYLDAINSGAQDYRGMVGDSSISIRVLKPLSIRASYRRDIEFSIWSSNAFYLENRIGAGVSFYLFKDIRLDFDNNIGRNTYPESQLLNQGISEKRIDDYRVQAIGIYFRLKKNIGTGVTLSQWVRESNLSFENSKRTFIGLNITYDF